MNEHSTIIRRTAAVGAIVFGVLGLMLGAVAGLIYDPTNAWQSSLILAVEAGLIGGALGAVAGFAFIGLRATLCRRSLSE